MAYEVHPIIEFPSKKNALSLKTHFSYIFLARVAILNGLKKQ